MRHVLVDTRHWMGWYDDEQPATLNWVFDVGGYTIELKQYPQDEARLRIRTYQRKLNPLPPKPFMWLGAEAEAA